MSNILTSIRQTADAFTSQGFDPPKAITLNPGAYKALLLEISHDSDISALPHPLQYRDPQTFMLIDILCSRG